MAKRANVQAFDITLTAIGRYNTEFEATVNPFRFLYATDYERNRGLYQLHFDNKLLLKVTVTEFNSFLALRAEVLRELAATFLAQLYAEATHLPPS